MANEVKVKVSADASPFAAGLAKIENSLDSFKDHAKEQFGEVGKEMAAGLAVGAAIEGIKSLVESSEELEHLSKRLGEPVESLERIGQAASLGGVEMETLAKATQKMTVNAVEAIRGNVELDKAFTAIGLSAAEFVDLPLEEKLLKLSEGWEQAGSNAEKMDAILKLLGKSGAELIPVLEQGPEALKASMNSATVASAESVEALAEFGENWKKIWATSKAYAIEALNGVITYVKYLGVAAASATAYIANLKNGFKEAKEAADETSKAGRKNIGDERRKAEEKPPARKLTDVDALQAQSAERKKAAEEQAKLEEEINKKLRDRKLESESLAERRKQLNAEIAAETDKFLAAKNPLDQLQSVNKTLDLVKQLDEADKKSAAERERHRKEQAEKAKKDALETVRAEISAEKEKIRAKESDIKRLSKDPFTVDSLRKIGGGVAKANYNLSGGKADYQKQQLDVAKETLETLRKQLAISQKKESAIQTYDGAFS